MTPGKARTRSPTIVLVGGPMTVDDGTSLDSRQPITGDPTSRISHACLTNSLLWWLTTASLVGPLLDYAGEEALVLALGNRSVVELKANGDLRRSRLSAVLPGGATTIDLVRVIKDEVLPEGFVPVGADFDSTDPDRSRGSLGCHTKDPARRWQFYTGNDFYLQWAGPDIGPAVIVDALVSEYGGKTPGGYTYETFERGRLFEPAQVLVLPHTHHTEKFLQGYLAWVAAGRHPSAAEEDLARLTGTSPNPTTIGPPGGTQSDWDPATPPDAC